MSLLSIVGALTFVTITVLWAYIKLVKWSISTDKDLEPGRVTRLWGLFVLVVLLVELGPPTAQVFVNVLSQLI